MFRSAVRFKCNKLLLTLMWIQLFWNKMEAGICDICAYDHCDSAGFCTYGCRDTGLTYKDGYCIGACASNCSYCHQDLCLTCDGGFYGYSCHVKCNTTCPSTGKCNRHFGICLSECVGNECGVEIPRGDSQHMSTYLVIASSVISGFLVLTIIGVIVWYARQTCREPRWLVHSDEIKGLNDDVIMDNETCITDGSKPRQQTSYRMHGQNNSKQMRLVTTNHEQQNFRSEFEIEHENE
ncbi:hypothetical protein MAR_008100 [Mya arenaria]|uniref:Uncharacterized protein n=1 Tax=Mya arenaria TaxID=6604 RepID=A0ABY7DY50_MYAAR|nr:uncharacterized protein LOC128232886 [Mya arenaria]WAR01542.1 hypothetical protein MAR_008100 [Mya arenaria]